VSRDWDAETYHRVSSPHVEWANVLLDRLDLRGDETVLDAGCGSGRVTLMLLERLPRGRVIAVDQASSMVEHAREALGDGATVLRADLMELELDERVDAVFSNAVFHWIPDHGRLFAALHAALRPGGRLVAQCGGEGNVAKHAVAIVTVASRPEFAPHFDDMEVMWNFASADQTEERLRGAGFDDVSCWLEERPVQPEDPYAFTTTVTMGPHLARLPEDLRRPFAEAVLELEDDPLVLNYVRLNIEARRPA
jgi:trans-aconitate 2-methyltransferase